ncbi:hypothetical protein AB0M02_17845 [Actinoplanes sp. NPDC051861]|uniref:hypothetical protein n=1 Tax=Actinoplanes sp. NPDC051861 TaxID=3155170 RepID=UPI0034465CD2
MIGAARHMPACSTIGLLLPLLLQVYRPGGQGALVIIAAIEVPQLWAQPVVIDDNHIRHLAVPAHTATRDSAESAASVHGLWPLTRTTVEGIHLHIGTDERVEWKGPVPALPDPAEVLESLHGRFRYIEASGPGSRDGLRIP